MSASTSKDPPGVNFPGAFDVDDLYNGKDDDSEWEYEYSHSEIEVEMTRL
jgi:hypothetical protein